MLLILKEIFRINDIEVVITKTIYNNSLNWKWLAKNRLKMKCEVKRELNDAQNYHLKLVFLYIFFNYSSCYHKYHLVKYTYFNEYLKLKLLNWFWLLAICTIVL